MTREEEILSIVRSKGPVLPADIAKVIKTNILIASAYLSELASRKKVVISSLKVGGSPLYYLPGQEGKLEQFSQNLNEKEYRAYELIKEKEILRDTELTPLMRVALRNIKDFAMPLNVKYDNKQELFWKWYLTKEEAAAELVRKELELETEKELESQKINLQKSEGQSEKAGEVEPSEKIEPAKTQDAPKIKREAKKKPEAIKKIKVMDKKEPKEDYKKGVTKEIKKKADKYDKKEIYGNESAEAYESALTESNQEFSARVRKFFNENGIKVVEENLIRKESEINFIIEVPSPVGELKYLCKAKNKKIATEKDLSAALVEGQLKRVPVVFLHTGKLSTKAQKLALEEPFRTMTFYRLDKV